MIIIIIFYLFIFLLLLQFTLDNNVPPVQTDRRCLLLHTPRLQMVQLGGKSLCLLWGKANLFFFQLSNIILI